MMSRIGGFCCFHWRKFAWGGTGVAITTLATQIDKPYSTWCYIAACICAILAANDRPERPDPPDEQGNQP